MTKNLRIAFAALASLLCLGLQAQQTATFVFTGDEAYGMTLLSGSTQEYNPDPYVCTEGNVTMTLTGNTRWWSASPNQLRIYGGGAMTFTTADNGTITSIEFDCNNTTSMVADVGNFETGSGSGSWTGSATSVTISRSGTSGNNRIYTATVTYTPGTGEPIVTTAAPTIEGATEFVGSTTATITGPEGSVVYYTTDGSEPTTESASNGTNSATLDITATTTVSAIAVADGVASSVATQTFTAIEVAEHTIASVQELTEDIDHIRLTLTEAKVVHVNGNAIHVREGANAIIFYNAGITLAQNDVVSGYVYGKYTNYRGIHELEASSMTNADHLTIAPSDVEAEPVSTTIDEVLAMQHKCDLVTISGVTLTSEVSGTRTNYYASAGESRIQLYGNTSILDEYVNDNVLYDLVAVFNSIYNGNAQLRPVCVSPTPTAPAEVAAPTIEGSAEFVGTTTVTITGPEGSVVYYTTDGSEPTAESACNGTNTVTLDITATTTVKAMAMVGTTASAVATSVFTAITFADHTIATLNELTEDLANIRLTLTEAKVVHVSGTNVFVRQGDHAIMFYRTDLDLPLNAVVSGSVLCDYDNYYGIPEVKDNNFTSAAELTVTPSDEAAQPIDVAIADLLALNHRCDLVRVSGVTISSEQSGNYTNYYATNADGERIQLFGGIDMSGYAGDGQSYDIVAVFNNIYNGAAEIAPITVDVASGIHDIIASGTQDGKPVIYSISGQRLSAPAKGINIINGKKVIVK